MLQSLFWIKLDSVSSSSLASRRKLPSNDPILLLLPWTSASSLKLLVAQSDTWFFLGNDGTLCAGKATPEIESGDGAGAKADAPSTAEMQRTMLDEIFMVAVYLKLSGIWYRGETLIVDAR